MPGRYHGTDFVASCVPDVLRNLSRRKIQITRRKAVVKAKNVHLFQAHSSRSEMPRKVGNVGFDTVECLPTEPHL